MQYAVKTQCNMQQNTRHMTRSKFTLHVFWLLLLDWFTNFYLLTEQPPRNALTRYKMQAKQEAHMFTERKHLRLYKKTRILIQRNHALTQRNACAYNKIFLHINPIVNRLAQRNACTCTKKNTLLYKDVPCTYTKKYMHRCQELGCLY